MITLDAKLTNEQGVPTLKRFVAYKIGKALDRKGNGAKAKAYKRVQLTNLARLLLHLTGFVCLTIAGFSATMPANIPVGFVVAGLSCFAMSWLSTSSPVDDDDQTEVDRPNWTR